MEKKKQAAFWEELVRWQQFLHRGYDEAASNLVLSAWNPAQILARFLHDLPLRYIKTVQRQEHRTRKLCSRVLLVKQDKRGQVQRALGALVPH